jgi:glycosyltransferase involved in cell wall biosynthesis
MPALDVVIVTWNNERHLGACLDSLARVDRGNFRLQKVVVVDNASRDGSAALAESFYGRRTHQVIRRRAKHGVAPAGNRGAPANSAE